MRHLRLVPVLVILALAIAGAAAALAADDPGTETKTLSDPAVDAWLRLPGGTATVASPRRVLAPGHRGAFALRLSVPARAELARSGKLHARLWVHQRVGSRTRLDRRDALLTAR